MSLASYFCGISDDKNSSSWYTWTNTKLFILYPQIKDIGDKYLVRTEIPGYNKEEINIEVENNILTISAAKKEKDNNWELSNTYSNSISLPSDINFDKANAELENGVLIITIPKIKPDKQILQIKIA